MPGSLEVFVLFAYCIIGQGSYGEGCPRKQWNGGAGWSARRRSGVARAALGDGKGFYREEWVAHSLEQVLRESGGK